MELNTTKRQLQACSRGPMGQSHAMTATTPTILLILLLVCPISSFDVIADIGLSEKAKNAVTQLAFGVSQEVIGHSSAMAYPLADDLPLNYSIFNGSSCMRYLHDNEAELFNCSKELSKTAIGALLLMNGLSDAAHECILGVTPNNVEEAEYAATHRGKTSWSQDHPLSYEDDILHALVHLREGDMLGEGNYTGWDNAKYWITGGPKKLYGMHNDKKTKETKFSTVEPPTFVLHPIERALIELAQSKAPNCSEEGLISNNEDGASYEIIAGGGTYRTVIIPPARWDPIMFIDLCSRRNQLNQMLLSELNILYESILKLILRYELLRKVRTDGTFSLL